MTTGLLLAALPVCVDALAAPGAPDLSNRSAPSDPDGSIHRPSSVVLPPSYDGPAELARLAPESLLLDAARAGPRLVAVGERGHILLSSDEGRTWRQAPSPTRATLTAVAFADARHGWAAGHLGTILRTTDGGETWIRCPTGLDPEAVFLDLLALSPTEAWAVGAYGLLCHTADGGATWEHGNAPGEQMHFNRIVRTPADTLFLVGESGTLLRSTDRGATWESVPPPYNGSLFNLLPLPDGTLLVHGLRGRVFRSTDGGTTWASVDTPVPTLLMSGVTLPDGTIVLAGQSGLFFVSRDAGRRFSLWHPAGSTGVARLLATADGGLLALGEKGARRLDPPPAPE